MRRRKGKSKADIASRKSSKQRTLEGEFLEGTESSFERIEAMPNEGFNDAWNEAADPAVDASLDAAIDVGQQDTLGDLDKSLFKRIVVGLVLCGAVVGAGFWVTQTFVSETEEPVARAAANSDPNILVSPVDERVYEPASSSAVIEEFSVLDDWFVDVGSSGSVLPRPSNALEVSSAELDVATEATTAIGTVFWAGRLHVAVLSDQPVLTSANQCAVVALAAVDLSSVDVAGVGDCGEVFEATGDRLACEGTNAVLVEVWPRNPDAVNDQPPVESIRVRIEYGVGTDVVSQRGTIEAASQVEDLVSRASALTGEPGDEVQLEVGGQSQTCVLADRSNVEVRLLPG